MHNLLLDLDLNIQPVQKIKRCSEGVDCIITSGISSNMTLVHAARTQINTPLVHSFNEMDRNNQWQQLLNTL